MPRQPDAPRQRTPDELRDKAIALFDKKVVRLEDAARELIKLLGRAIDGLKAELFEGLGYKNPGLSDSQVRRLKEITASFNSASDAQCRLDRTAHMRAKELTAEERKAFTADFILTLPPRERAEWIRDVIKRHDELKLLTVGGRAMLGVPAVQAALAEEDDYDYSSIDELGEPGA